MGRDFVSSKQSDKPRELVQPGLFIRATADGQRLSRSRRLGQGPMTTRAGFSRMTLRPENGSPLPNLSGRMDPYSGFPRGGGGGRSLIELPVLAVACIQIKSSYADGIPFPCP